jgi:hypothetical protein
MKQLLIGTVVERTNSPTTGIVGVISSKLVPVVETYLVTFPKTRMMPQYWSPMYFKVLEMPKPSWEV